MTTLSTPRAPQRRPDRPGNALVLVTGILVLLVLVATAYVTRTGSGRVTSTASRRIAERTPVAERVHETLAQMIAEHLFVHPIDPFDPEVAAGRAASSNWTRFTLLPNQRRYDRDKLPTFSYNFAPYEVRAWTNLPDLQLPGYLLSGRDIVGNPGFGDTRWLRSTEPARIDSVGRQGAAGNVDAVDDGFTHWPHLTNLGTANNGIRIVKDIADVMGADVDFNQANIVDELGVPFEQWNAVIPESVDVIAGTSAMALNNSGVLDYFNLQFNRWFAFDPTTGDGGWRQAFLTGDRTLYPGNLWDLNDIDGDFLRNEVGERPVDAYIRGTARWNVERRLADTDGDGLTDAFWHLLPFSSADDIKHLVAVSVVDNSSMAPVNTGSRFVRRDPFPDDPAVPFDPNVNPTAVYRTMGLGPSDYALISDHSDLNGGNALPLFDSFVNVGFFDSRDYGWSGSPPSFLYGFVRNIFFRLSSPPSHPGQVAGHAGHPVPFAGVQNYVASYWHPMWRGYFDASTGRPYNFQYATGIMDPETGGPHLDLLPANNGVTDGFGNDPMAFATNRIRYWLLSGRQPYVPATKYTPFGIPDEIELRMYAGNNAPNVVSRLERVMQPGELNRQAVYSDYGGGEFLRSSVDREESNAFADRISAREMFVDPRHRMTMFSNARNDEMPPWLWFRDNGAIGDPLITRKGDLRAPTLDADDVFRRLYRSFISENPSNVNDPLNGAYWGDVALDGVTVTPNFQRTANMAFSMTRNLADAMDADDTPTFLPGAVPGAGLSTPPNKQYAGVERQPFLVEAFIAHVYTSRQIADPPSSSTNYVSEFDANGNAIPRTTIVAVQIANPFPRGEQGGELDLSDFAIRVFGRTFNLPAFDLAQAESRYDPTLVPADNTRPETAIVYLIDGSVVDLDEWREYLRIRTIDHPAGTRLIAVPTDDSTWSSEPAHYWSDTELPSDDAPAAQSAIELINRNANMVVDRFRMHNSFISDSDYARDTTRVAVRDLIGTSMSGAPSEIPRQAPPSVADPDYESTWDIGSNDYIASMYRVTRPWGVDWTGPAGVPDGQIQPNEINPRYVFATHEETTRVRVLHDPVSPAPLGARITRFEVQADNIPGKGYTYENLLQFPLQFTHRNGRMLQIGELMNLWTWGPEFSLLPVLGDGGVFRPERTFAEFMVNPRFSGLGDTLAPPGTETQAHFTRVNRLQVSPIQVGTVVMSRVIGQDDPMQPNLPAGVRLMDGFVIDNVADTTDPFRAANANGFSTSFGTAGLININTAPTEVLRGLPHLDRLVREARNDEFGNSLPLSTVRIAEAVQMYRDGRGPDPLGWGYNIDFRPDYSDRNPDPVNPDGRRQDAGFRSIGELLLLTKTGTHPNPIAAPISDLTFNDSFAIDFAARRPYRNVANPNRATDVRLSTDVAQPYAQDLALPAVQRRMPDHVSMDAEEQTLLFSGLSNMITTRSDTFTVYMRIRSFKQNPANGVWDATDPEYIVDDTRYVMLVDRSNVNAPGDQPRILYVREVPD
ncbi:MAG: hypothetical protein KDA25_01515 [Phycisphaerales bacterium]|nr:hypothetical protein [Phycisphaerales bacterium]